MVPILQAYTKAEIDEFETWIVEERNHLFTYSSLDVLLKRYVIHTHQLLSFETPQEMFMGIAMHLAMNETQNRSQWVKRFYDMLSQLQVTMATPTLSNARKPFHQLSSCFIDTVPDSLTGIYRSIDKLCTGFKIWWREWECTLEKYVQFRFSDSWISRGCRRCDTLD